MEQRIDGMQWEAIFEAAHDAIVTVDARDRIIAFNRAAGRLLGHSRDDVLGQPVARVMDWPPPADNGRAEVRAWRHGGHAFAADASFTLVGEGDSRLRTVVLREMPEPGAAMRLLREAKDAAEAAVGARCMLVAQVAHEVRTPLNALLGSMELMGEAPRDEARREYLRTARASGQALAAIVDDLRDLTRLEAGGLRIDPRRMELEGTLRDAVALVAAAAGARGVRVTHALDQGVPRSIVADGDRLRQVLVNLLANAVKFAEGGEVMLRAEACADDGDGVELHFAVRDSGAGIAAADLPKLFEPFSQLAEGRRRGGTGLGLAISKRLCELMGGRIWAESAPGAGSTFHFTIRARLADRVETTAQAMPAVSARRLDVLVVDDDPANRAVVAAMVERLGHDASVASNAAQALHLCARRRFDAVVTDIDMDGMDGVEMARRIRRAGGGPARIVALTGHVGAGFRDLLPRDAFDACLMKPVASRELRRALEDPQGGTAPSVAACDDAIDVAQIESLRDLAPGDAVLAEVVRSFIGQAALAPRQLRMHAGAGDRRRLEQLSHRTASAALACGAARVARVCRDLEESGAHGALWRAPALIDRLQREIEEACAALAPLARAA